MGAYQRIKEAGLKIPDDIAIMGFSNNKITSLVDPQLDNGLINLLLKWEKNLLKY